MNKDKMLVEAIRDGIVLDHIPAEKLFQIVALLRLDELTTPVTIGNNLVSARQQRKGIIKMADHFVSPQEIDKIALLAPEVHLNVIRDYQVTEKRQVALPSEVKGCKHASTSRQKMVRSSPVSWNVIIADVRRLQRR